MTTYYHTLRDITRLDIKTNTKYLTSGTMCGASERTEEAPGVFGYSWMKDQ